MAIPFNNNSIVDNNNYSEDCAVYIKRMLSRLSSIINTCEYMHHKSRSVMLTVVVTWAADDKVKVGAARCYSSSANGTSFSHVTHT